MKSFLYVAPLLPPPPYTWLTTTSGEMAGIAPGCDADPTRLTTPAASASTTNRRTPRMVLSLPQTSATANGPAPTLAHRPRGVQHRRRMRRLYRTRARARSPRRNTARPWVDGRPCVAHRESKE